MAIARNTCRRGGVGKGSMLQTNNDKVDTIVEWVKRDALRVKALKQVYDLGLPQCYIAAGFVRNLVWDALHKVEVATPLNDVDVIYFDPKERNQDSYLVYESMLRARMPEINWQVRNQAKMHIRNQDLPYKSTLHAMQFWPEKETAVAISLTGAGHYECIAAFGFASLFSLCITHNPKRSRSTFKSRIYSKGWLVQWPRLRIVE